MTLGAFLHYALEAITNADAKLYLTLRTLVTRPGVLTREFMCGRRQPYLGPLQLFLVCNVAFFVLLQLGLGTNAFTTDLIFHRQQPLYGDAAEALLTQKLGDLPERHTGRALSTWVAHSTPEQQEFRRRFNEASPRYANSLVILMVPLFALGIRLLRRRGLFVRELVFSFHFYSILLLVNIVLPPILLLFSRIYRPWTPFLDSEELIVLIMLAVCVTYLSLGFRSAYRDRWPAALGRGLIGFLLVALVLTLYRAILFFVVFWAM
jgi:hypothetical protein